MAIEIEKRGFYFYKAAYDKAEDVQAKALFKVLMEEEQQHQIIFTEFFNQIAACKEAHSAEYLFDEETSRYLTVLVESHVFPPEHDVEHIISNLKNTRNIVKLAMGAEKDSILLYDELAKSSKFADAKKVFIKLKGEEQHHVTELSQKLKQIL
jgi:rubrerythrin